jgi:hypothetical protein
MLIVAMVIGLSKLWDCIIILFFYEHLVTQLPLNRYTEGVSKVLTLTQLFMKGYKCLINYNS